jgi:hypothetical protein
MKKFKEDNRRKNIRKSSDARKHRKSELLHLATTTKYKINLTSLSKRTLKISNYFFIHDILSP